jgi:hypothetical protein
MGTPPPREALRVRRGGAGGAGLTRCSEDRPADRTPDPGRLRLPSCWTARARPRASAVAPGRRAQRAPPASGAAPWGARAAGGTGRRRLPVVPGERGAAG